LISCIGAFAPSRFSGTLEKGEEAARRWNSCAPPPYHGVEEAFVAQADAWKRSSLPAYQAISAFFSRGDDRRTTRSGSRSREGPGETSGIDQRDKDCLLPIVC
jgi:hypothetical protein